MNTSKIIKAAINATKYTVTAPVIKEDYGLFLKIEGADLPSTYEVDFSNEETGGTSVTMIGTAADGVHIPNQFIKSGRDVFAFLYLVGEDYGRTAYKFKIPNKLRPDRTDATPAPEEQSLIDQAINALNTAVEQTAADVETTTAKAAEATSAAATATQKALEATESAQSAGTYATRAETALHGAETARTASQQSATASAMSAEQAAGSALTASTKAGDASASATSAAQSASSAGQSALDARDYKDAANLSAESASGYAGAASDSATTATEQALIATQKASESAQSALDASTAKDNAVTAKNAAETAQSGAELARTGAETAQAAAEAAVYTKADGIVDTATGAVASFPDGADDFPMKSLKVAIEPVQDLSHGDPSPENICPIEGWTGAQVMRTGKNLFGGEAFARAVESAAYAPQFSIDTDAKIFTFTRGDKNTDGNYTHRLFDKFSSPQVTAIITYSNSASNTSILLRYTDNSAAQISLPSTSGLKATVVLSSLNGKTVDCVELNYFGNGSTTIYYDESGFFEGVVALSDFKPYTGNVYPISWETEAGTVYGGTLDVISGELVVDRAMTILDGSNDEVWTLQSINSYGIANFYTYVDHYPAQNYKTFCDMFPSQTSLIGETETEGYFSHQNGSHVYIRIYSHRASTSAEMREWLASNPIHFVFGLVEPITYHLTPTEARTLLGTNNVWADTGDSAVEYRADTKRYIDKRIAELG